MAMMGLEERKVFCVRSPPPEWLPTLQKIEQESRVLRIKNNLMLMIGFARRKAGGE